MTAPSDAFGLEGASLDGKYDVERVVAEGGFGVVYRATHCGLQRPVAIKVLKTPAGLDARLRSPFLDTFTQEARLIAALDHPAIVRVLDFGVGAMPLGGTAPWMVLEWIEGTSLEDHIAARGAGSGVDPIHAMQLLEPVFEAIAYAHEEGVVHRDLKPANMMLVRSRRGDTSLRVLDFGIAKVMGREERTSSGHTATNAAMQAFSLPYAAPEQLTAMRTGPWTDVHALALIVVEVLTGVAPFAGADVAELYAAALAPQRPTPRARGVDVGAWEPVLARALAFRPAERFPDARSFLDALRGTLPGAHRRSLAADGVSFAASPQGQTPPTLRGTTHERRNSAPKSVWVRVGIIGATLVLAIAAGASFLSSRSVAVPSARSASDAATTAITAPPHEVTRPSTVALPEETRDAGAAALTSTTQSSAARVRFRMTERGGGARRSSGAAPHSFNAPASSTEQLPVE